MNQKIIQSEEQVSGFLLVDKPINWTSFDIVAKLRGITGIRKIGHAGTLDPLATGLLIVAIGRQATKQIDTFVKLDKVYETTIRLGAITDTYDAEGQVKEISDRKPLIDEVQKTLKTFIGNLKQVPPMYSAKKVNGKKLYDLARKGIQIERKANDIKISELILLDYIYPDVRIRVSCSTGTYIRSLAFDIGQELGVGAYITELRRISISGYSVDNAKGIDYITSKNWRNLLI